MWLQGAPVVAPRRRSEEHRARRTVRGIEQGGDERADAAAEEGLGHPRVEGRRPKGLREAAAER